jgi:hypothetical protein
VILQDLSELLKPQRKVVVTAKAEHTAVIVGTNVMEVAVNVEEEAVADVNYNN